jgi:Mycoplasma protein of unknown function, DUF285
MNFTTVNVMDMSFMFQNAISFQQNITQWNINQVTSFTGMFHNATKYSYDLCAWTSSSSMTTTLMKDGTGDTIQDMFTGTSCPDTSAPRPIGGNIITPMCYPCTNDTNVPMPSNNSPTLSVTDPTIMLPTVAVPSSPDNRTTMNNNRTTSSGSSIMMMSSNLLPIGFYSICHSIMLLLLWWSNLLERDTWTTDATTSIVEIKRYVGKHTHTRSGIKQTTGTYNKKMWNGSVPIKTNKKGRHKENQQQTSREWR